MQVLEAGVCQLSNFEVYTSLQAWRGKRGGEQILPSEAVFALETSLLRSTFKTEKGLGRAQVDAFLIKVDDMCSKYPSPNGEPMYLTPAEKIQLMNTKPVDTMCLELLVEGMITDERVEEAHIDNFASDVLACVQHYLINPEFKEKAKDLVYISSSDEEGENDGDEKKTQYYDPAAVLVLHADGLPVVIPPVKEIQVVEAEPIDFPMEVVTSPPSDEIMLNLDDDDEEKEKKKTPSKKQPKSRKKRDPSTDSGSESASSEKKPRAKGNKSSSKKTKKPSPSSSDSSAGKKKKKKKKKDKKSKDKKGSSKKKK